jgi:hypothetical protein
MRTSISGRRTGSPGYPGPGDLRVKEDIWNLLRCCVRMGRARIRRLRHQRRLWDVAFEGAAPVQRARKISCVFTIPTIGEGIKGSRCCSHALT